MLSLFCSDLVSAFFPTVSSQHAVPMSQCGSLPDPAADCLSHYQALPIRPHTLEEATYTGGLAGEDVVVWAKGLTPPPQLIHVDMRSGERAGWVVTKGWAPKLFEDLQSGLAELRAVRSIPGYGDEGVGGPHGGA